MAAPNYTHDLNIASLAESVTGWDESGTWDRGGPPIADSDYPYIQGNVGITHICSKTGLAGLMFDNGSDMVIPTDGAYFVWQVMASPFAIDNYVNGGMRLMVGSDYDNFKGWIVGGNDYGKNPYGGWMNQVVNPTIAADYTVGSPTTTKATVGGCLLMTTAIGKGAPHGIDSVRYGRGTSIFTLGESANPSLFSGFATLNDALTARWGLIQWLSKKNYLFKGVMSHGTSSTMVYSVISNVNITIDDTPKVTPNFNRIEFHHADSIIDWTNVNFESVGTVSRGRLEFHNNPTTQAKFTNSTYTDLDTFIYLSNVKLLGNVYRRCNLVTQNGALFDTCIFEASTNTPALLSDNPTNIVKSTFVSAGTGHAMELNTPGTYSLDSCVFTDYGADDTTDAAIYNNSGGQITINITGTGLSPTVLNGSGATTTVQSGATLTLTGLKLNSDVVILEAGTDTVLDSVDQEPTSSWGYSYAIAQPIDIGIIKPGYITQYIYGYSLTSNDASLPIQQLVDRSYQ